MYTSCSDYRGHSRTVSHRKPFAIGRSNYRRKYTPICWQHIIDYLLQLVCYIAHDIVTTEIRHAHEQGYVEDKRLASASNQILYYMDSTGANSPLIGNIFYPIIRVFKFAERQSIVKLVHSMKGARWDPTISALVGIRVFFFRWLIAYYLFYLWLRIYRWS